jgi:hypothetical protein
MPSDRARLQKAGGQPLRERTLQRRRAPLLPQCDGELEIGKDYYAKLTVSGKFIPG